MTDPTREALDSIRRSVEQAAAAGEDVRRATEQAVRQAGDRIEAGGERFSKAAQSALEGAKRRGAETDGPLKDVLDGLGDAVTSAANASRLAMAEATSTGRRFAEEDLRRARDEMRTLGELFGRTLTDAVERATGRTRDAVSDLERHASRVADRVGPSLQDAANAATSDPAGLARDSATAAVQATQAGVASVFETMGRLLEETGKAIGGAGRGGDGGTTSGGTTSGGGDSGRTGAGGGSAG
jgi:F0F1-type ATP synthase membrane subunit b/b'